ncbi:MAG: hypothetical protein JWQ49_4159 [Edaphobacter sp.]|nr:hypothetical protein [Edaphobacter sp.]
MTDGERNRLARAWITLQTTPQHAPEYNSLFWAFTQSYDLAREEPMEAWQLILAIWSLDKSIPTKQSLSTGFIEELLCYHGEFMIQHVERQAKADRSFATLLGAVRRSTMPDDVWNRLQDVWIAAEGALFLHHVGVRHREKLPPGEVVESALVEFAKLAALLLCMLSLYAIFRTLFLSVENPRPILQSPQVFTNRALSALRLISLSAAISFLGAIIFREAEPDPHPSLASTLPLQVFSWATSIMLVLFFLAWFLETHYVFTPSVHW